MKVNKCKICGKEFSSKYSKPRLYCSRECRNNDEELKQRSIESQKKTYQEKYGGHPMSTTETKRKHREVMLERYGVAHSMSSEELRLKAVETRIKKYGTVSFNNLEKRRATKLERYGNATYNGQRKRTAAAFSKKLLEWDDISIVNFDSNLPIKEQRVLLRCNSCGREWDACIDNNYKPSCKACSTSYTRISKGHQEVIDFLSTLNLKGEIKVNDRSVLQGDELDIYLPAYNLAIEFNGIFFHSDTFLSKDYHIKKTSRCLARGIQLVHVFDYLWWGKKELIMSMLKSKLGLFHTRLYARKCRIKIINSTLKRDFLNQNHLQGDANSGINLGLFSGTELVSVLTFGKSRFDKKIQWELIRFASRQGIQVVGGFSKLLQFFIKQYSPDLILSYCDRTWSSGDTYYRAGFVFDKFTVPNYYYFKEQYVYSRQQFQKHKLPSLLLKFDSNKTEMENMSDNGYRKFWDCGNVRLLYNVLDKRKRGC